MSDTDTNTKPTPSTKEDAIDAAINKLETRKGIKTGKTAAQIAADEAAKLQRKNERDAARAAKKAEKLATKAANPPHMSKVSRAAAGLPTLGDEAKAELDRITCNFSAATITALAQHLLHFNRAKSTERALATPAKLTVGQEVTILAGEPKFVGKTGRLTKVQRIRCFVAVPGFAREAYLFTSDVAAVEAKAEVEDTDDEQATGTEG